VKQRSMDKKLYLVLIVAVLVLIIGIYTILDNMNKTTVPKPSEVTAKNQTGTVAPAAQKLTAWNIIKMNDWFNWPFLVIMVVGTMMIIYRMLIEHQEKSRAQVILQKNIKPNEIKRFIQVVRGTYPNRMSRLLRQMIATFNKTKQAETIGADVNQFLTRERESFETFNRVTGFLSESAGAFGLLGTVWGIFMTFHSGKMDGPMILKGMSIALVTTLVGLIISLMINMGATYVFTLFNDQMKLLSLKAEELRQALLALEKKHIEIDEPKVEQPQPIRMVESEFQPKLRRRMRQPLEISGDPL